MSKSVGLMILLLTASVVALPAGKLPQSRIEGRLVDSSFGPTKAYYIRDAVALWWTNYGASKNLLQIHFFTEKLKPDERKAFIEKMEPLTDMNVMMGGDKYKKDYHPVFYKPRFILQFSGKKKPKRFEDLPLGGYSSTWYTGKGISTGSSFEAPKFTMKGLAWDGGEVTFSGEGSGGGFDPKTATYKWAVKGSAPFVIKN